MAEQSHKLFRRSNINEYKYAGNNKVYNIHDITLSNIEFKRWPERDISLLGALKCLPPT